MNPETTRQRLRGAFPGLRQRFALAHLGVLGSVARGTAGPDSDVTILVEFEDPATLDGFMGLKEELEHLLGVRVDLATPRSLRPSLLALVKKELRMSRETRLYLEDILEAISPPSWSHWKQPSKRFFASCPEAPLGMVRTERMPSLVSQPKFLV